MKILLLGGSGQLGWEIRQRAFDLNFELHSPVKSEVNISDAAQLKFLAKELKPEVIVNCAAYTAVDKAESEPDRAFLINRDGAINAAEAANQVGARLIHISTDYVFDGAVAAARAEDDPTGPLNVYGASKLAGEQAIAAAGIPHLIFRTSWVYGMRGKNFLLTMLRLARERDELRVVADQHGAPTWSRTIADVTAQVLAQAHAGGREWWVQNRGVYHLTAQGQTTWYDFTRAILAEAGLNCRVVPITSAEYPVPARRPEHSVLSSEKLMARFCHLPEWQHALQLCMR